MKSDLGEENAEAYIAKICFKTGPPRHTGVELEWLVHDSDDPTRAVPPEHLDEALAPLGTGGGLPHGATVTREPGGQIELSSRPAPGAGACAEATAADLAVLRKTLTEAGLTLRGHGLDPYRDVPPRTLDHPRYRAMEIHYDRRGPWGRRMMRSTASVQINLDAGDTGGGVSGFRFRWELAHRIGPVLVAAFANSPLWRGRPTGWKSGRQHVWANIDPGRTRPPATTGDPRTDWARYALDAHLMCLRRPAPASWTAPPGLPLRAWLGDALTDRSPSHADLDYHLSTLFPPVRPRGWLELRMIDAQDGDHWPVPLMVASALLDDPVAAEAAHEATAPLTEGAPVPPWPVWLRAARHGPADPLIGRAARACFDAAAAALARGPAPGHLQGLVPAFADRYTLRGRCPADDLLDAHPAPHEPPPLLEGAP
ncbi:ergothioneine biosynthesis glutamate--cysteine ligase EgtA [Streptomyces sodiiphilus]|uniref:Glutamate--cysteine ligase EgtA n=1 Tax=Streptomyces sodiiphilus TaxID=226217 RepID=A0ABP5AG33_9ACTN